MRCVPARPVRACFVRSCCGVVVREHSWHFTLNCSHRALHTSHLHFTLHTSSHLKSRELFSPHLSSSHIIPSLLTCHLSKLFFFSSKHSSAPLSSPWSSSQLVSGLFCAPESSYCQREVSCTKQDAAHEPECTHLKHLCETGCLNSLVYVSPLTVPVHCKLWNAEGGGVQSVECGV